MENAVDALKIAFAVFIFVLSLSIAFMAFSQAAQTSNKMLFASDPTNYYRYTGAVLENGRIVTSDVVISSLYRYYKESIVVKILDNLGNEIEIFNTATDGLNSQEQRKQRVDEFVKGTSLNKEARYSETFQEVTKNGKYAVGEDGTIITEEAGQTSIYITYRMLE